MPETTTTVELLTLGAAAKLLGIGPQRLHKWAIGGIGPRPVWIDQEGPGRPSKDGRSPRWTRTEIERWIHEVETGAAPELADADAQVMAYRLSDLYGTIRALSPDELNASLEAIHDILAELRKFPNVAAVWAAVGMAMLADAKARGIEIRDLAAATMTEDAHTGMYL